jgi:hypothetical protein
VRRHHEDLRPIAGPREVHDLADELDAGELGHQVVGDQQVERPLADEPQRLARASGRGDLMPLVAQRLDEGLPDFRFVVDEENGPQK